jgi:acetyltransferase-like isoleucine patch superfamily enzyme
VLVGRASWIGIGATVKNGVHIGSDAVVGAGALVLRDIPDGVVCYGVPAHVVGQRA